MGTDRARVIVKNGNIFSVMDMKGGLKVKDEDVIGLKPLIDIINDSSIQALKAEYDGNNFSKIIEPKVEKGIKGGWYSIELKDFKFINDLNYSFDIRQERMNEFKTNYQKWIKLDAENYSFICQDSKENERYIEGIEATFSSGKIVKARDARSLQPIADLENQSFLTIPDLFDIVKKRLEKNQQISIQYSEKYGYPYSIAYKDNDGRLRKIYSLNFRKGLKLK